MAAKQASKAPESNRGFGLARAVTLALLSLTAGGYSSGQPTTVTLRGRVVEDSTSTPIRSAELRFRTPGMRVLTADLESDSDGKFTASEMPTGDYDVTASRAGYAPLVFRLRLPIGDVTVRMTRYGVIDGKVVNASGKPVPSRVLGIGGRQMGGAQVVILTKQPDSDELRIFSEVNMGDANDGRYRVYNLPPGEYAVGLWYSAIDEGAGMQIFSDNAHPRIFSIQGGEEFNDVDFVVNPHLSSHVSGKVEIPEGAKGQYWVSLGLPDHFRIPLVTVQAGEDGSFQFDKIPAGRYDLFVAGPAGGRFGTRGIAPPGTTILFGHTQIQVAGQDVENLNIPVHAGKTLNVLLHSANPGNAGCPANVEVNASSPEPWPVMLPLRAQASFQKPVALSNLPPGKLSVGTPSLDDCFVIGDRTPLDLNGDNSPQQILIELTPGGSVKGTLRPVAPGSLAVLKSVALSSNAGEALFTARAYTGEDGQFEFHKLAPGLYRIEAAGYRGAEVEVKGGATSELNLTSSAQRSAQ
jgi:hypothetical protein